MEQLRGNKALSSALTAITGAIVGVMLNLAIWFGIHTVFTRVDAVTLGPFTFDWPVLRSINWPAFGLTLAAIAAVFVFKRGLLTTLIGACVAGLVMQQFGWVS